MRLVACVLMALVGILTMASPPARAREASGAFRDGIRLLASLSPQNHSCEGGIGRDQEAFDQ